MPIANPPHRPRWTDVLIIASILVLVGWRQVPAHWATMWMDREFTGWVAPIANRIGSEGRLYEDGLHAPMPPLPAIFLRIITNGHATWLDESRWNYIFQAAHVIIIYLFAARWIRPPVPLIAALATAPIFLSLPKTIVYDASSQFLTAAAGLCCVQGTLLRRRRHEGPMAAPAWLLLGGALTGLDLLTKQNAGAGAMVGIVMMLVVFGRRWPISKTVTAIGLYAAATMAAYLAVAAALTPWVSFSGLVTDTLLRGTEPKGGPTVVGPRLITITLQVVWQALFTYGILIILAWTARYRPLEASPDFKSDEAPRSCWGWLACAAAIAAITAFVIRSPVLPPSLFTRIDYYFIQLLELSLGGLIFLAFRGAAAAADDDPSQAALAALGWVFIPAAIFFNLSVRGLRWNYDNNTLIGVTALLIVFALTQASGRTSRSGWWGRAAVCAGLLVAAWTHYLPQYQSIRACTVEWTDTPFLAGARLPESGEKLHRVVETVRSIAPDPTDTVLLLPNDPDLEARFNRPRPRLTSAIVFTDQYWDSYVTEDFDRLSRDPPRVIVIGPTSFWRPFFAQWNQSRGTERLIDKVLNELIPARYVKQGSYEINFGGRPDFMDVYLLKPSGTAK